MTRARAFAPALLALVGCGEFQPTVPPGLRINEVVSDNEGVWLDEQGETDDYIELFNTSRDAQSLSDYALVDKGGERELPDLTVGPHGRLLLWADGSPEQGILHLALKVSSGGETIRLVRRRDGAEMDRVEVPPLAEHHAFARMPDGVGRFVDCDWATPGRSNGTACGPRDTAEPPDDVVFAPYAWHGAWPPVALPLAVSELRLTPEPFVEIANSSDVNVRLDRYELWVAPHRIGDPWPVATSGVVTPLPTRELAPGERVSIELSAEDVARITADPRSEGVVTIAEAGGAAVDRFDFSSWPPGAVAARFPEPDGSFRYCTNATPGAPNATCDELAERPISDHERRLMTPGDFHALGQGRGGVGIESVEFVVDMPSGDVVTFLNSKDYDLHYTFVREVIQKLPHLDRCDPTQRLLYNQGWFEFSNTEYFQVEGRRYLLGTLVRHAGSDYSTVEFAAGDTISPEQMRRAFFTVTKNVNDPKIWLIRPTEPDQIPRLRAIEGTVPALGPNAPFRGVTFQALTPGLTYGRLRFVPAAELRSTALEPHDIVVTDNVPNDIPLIAGLITEAFQTPLAHVNILSRGRGTPNMALRDARNDPRLKPYFDTDVRLSVEGTDFTLGPADPEEANAFWESRRPDGPPLTPRLDLETRGVVPLESRGLADIPTVGGKAAQVAELLRVPFCTGPVSVPDRPFAIPMVYSVEHFEKSGARALLDRLLEDAEFLG
ncbi:MAG TPA: lamin tail domain-containing protein, partial [Polyangiaceae bacterium]